MKLTAVAVERTKPPASGRLEIWDTVTPGLGLRITPAGSRSWNLLVRVRGRLTRYTIGRYPAVGLSPARDIARRLLVQIEAGEPPSSRRAGRHGQDTVTVPDLISTFVALYQKPRNRSWRKTEQLLRRELAPWSGRQIGDVTRRDVIQLLDGIAGRAPVTANRALSAVRLMFSWAVDRGLLAASPATGVRAPTREVSRDRVLMPAELAALWRASQALQWPFAPYVRLLMLTAQRRSEVAGMAWRALDLESRTWTLPREATKSDRAHEVPLSDPVLAIIRELPTIGQAGLVFPSVRNGREHPFTTFSDTKAQLDRLSGVTGWQLRDLRRTAATGMAMLGHPPHVVAAVLNHAPGSTMGISAVYVRHRFQAEKRVALDDWARALMGWNEKGRPEP